jgi:3-oxoacyl-(acyl-carrier-protein) synthase
MNDLYIENAAAIGPLGQSLDEIWNKLLAGETAYGRVDLPSGRSFFAAETVENSASSIAAYAPLFYEAIRALVDSLKVEVPVDAIFFGTAVGNLAYVENEVYSCRDLPVERLDFSELETIFAQTPAWGPETRFICVPTGCCAGVQATGLARKIMFALGLRRAIVMSLDFGLTPMGFEAFDKINASTPFDPILKSSPSRPFCKRRTGFLFADGGGAILVTTEPGDTELPRITGYGCVSSAFHMTDISTDGHSIRASIERAMEEAQLSADQISHVNLHASGTQQNDLAEYQAMATIFGATLPLITAFKGNHGHALGGANMIEIAVCWKILRERLVPPTPVALAVDAYEAVRPRVAATFFEGRSILKTASGFSGIHASLIMEH